MDEATCSHCGNEVSVDPEGYVCWLCSPDHIADLEKRLAEAERENRRLRGERDEAIQCLKDERVANVISDHAGTLGWPALEVSCLKCDAATERAEKAEARLKTLCFHVHDDPARAENQRLREALHDIESNYDHEHHSIGQVRDDECDGPGRCRCCTARAALAATPGPERVDCGISGGLVKGEECPDGCDACADMSGEIDD